MWEKLLDFYNDVNNQQDATSSFINLFQSAQHASGDKFAHPQEHFLSVCTAFSTMHRLCCQPVPQLRWKCVPSQLWHRLAREAVHCIKPLYNSKVLLRMSEFVARNMLGWLKNINKRNSCIFLVVHIVVLVMHGHTNIQFPWFFLYFQHTNHIIVYSLDYHVPEYKKRKLVQIIERYAHTEYEMLRG